MFNHPVIVEALINKGPLPPSALHRAEYETARKLAKLDQARKTRNEARLMLAREQVRAMSAGRLF